MNKRGKVSTQNLPEIDVDAIVEEGKKRQKNKKKFFTSLDKGIQPVVKCDR